MTSAAAGLALRQDDLVVPRPARRTSAKPVLRLIHHMARSGGTVISRCLGCMSGVVLLSEIHPLGLRQFNPLAQAQRWFGLLSSHDLGALAARGQIGFADAIELIHRRAEECNQRLVIRDWSHLDFTGVPFVARPAYRLLLAEACGKQFDLRQVCTVRHPLDQWLSLRRLAILQGKLVLPDFLAGYRRFAEIASEIGFFRYEDFTAEPAPVMKALCKRLELKFDAGFGGRWHEYALVTGDMAGSRAGSAIAPLPRRPVEAALLEELSTNDDYRNSLQLLGYEHPE
jgi:hypothetical protein